MLLNPGFEEVVDGAAAHWTPFGASSVGKAVPSTERARSGSYGLKLGDGATGGIGLRSSSVDAAVGETYEGFVFAYVESGAQFSVYLEFWNAAGARIATSFKTFSLPGVWQRVDLRATAPEGAVRATLLVYAPATTRGVASPPAR